MVIGDGLVASSFNRYLQNDKIVVFASGVSNSQCTDTAQFKREFNLVKSIIETNADKFFIYFSTCSVLDSSLDSSMYVNHKLEIENYIKQNANRFLIFRLSNLIGRTTNSNTIINYFINAIKNEKKIELWRNAHRNIIDVQHVSAIVSHIIDTNLYENKIINVANPKSINVLDLLTVIESFLQKKANYSIIEKGAAFNIDIPHALPVIENLGINFDDDYINSLLLKYFADEL
jgi:nucleoside-diphosphate-sugar epimerase